VPACQPNDAHCAFRVRGYKIYVRTCAKKLPPAYPILSFFPSHHILSLNAQITHHPTYHQIIFATSKHQKPLFVRSRSLSPTTVLPQMLRQDPEIRARIRILFDNVAQIQHLEF
jgi:hypothetical protein